MKYTNVIVWTGLMVSVCGGSILRAASASLEDPACAADVSTGSASASDSTITLSGPVAAASPLVGVKRVRAGAGAGNAVESVSAAHKRAKDA